MTAESVTAQPLSTPRAKHLTTQSPGALLRMALCEAGVSQSEVARAWGVDRRIVHDVIRGKKPVTAKRVAALPEAVRDAYYRLRAQALGRAWVRLPRAGIRAVDHHAMAQLSREHGETIAVMAEAYADGDPSDAHKREMARELREDIELKAAMLAALEAE